MNDSISIGDLAAILTAAGVTIYVLGLIGVAIPIRRAFTRDMTSAWYAVSLIPKTVVAGQGAKIWLQWPIVITTLLLFTVAAISLASMSVVASDVLLGVSLGIAAAIMGSKMQASNVPWGLRVVALLVMFAGQFPLYFALSYFNIHLPSFEYFPFTPSFFQRASNLPVGVLLIILASFLTGFPAAISAAPPLPEVKINNHQEPEQDRNERRGYLLAHSDGFWHLFDENKDLLSIPDDQVASVQMISKADTPPE